MRYSKLFGKTIKTVPKDATLTSHKLLYKAGFIRESASGRYYFLPLGMRVHQKIQKIIKDEMDKSGALEMVTPVLHPKSLWEETNRTTTVGFELMTIKDRSEMEFVLGGTAEEMLVDLVRKFQISYKDLPFTLYQFSTKFRDELRARGGLLRVREFVMKDAYSFDRNEEDFKKEYEKMKKTYSAIFQTLGLKTIIVESDNGYIGGDYSHEFVVESEVGESKFLISKDLSYAEHVDVAQFAKEDKNSSEEEHKLEEVEALRGTTMEEGVKLHQKPVWQQIKNVLFVDERNRFILASIRGDLDVNEAKLLHLTRSYRLRHATGEEIQNIFHSEPGFISPVGIKDRLETNTELVIVADDSLRTVKNTYTGANVKHKDLVNVTIDRDYKADLEGDIALAKEGQKSRSGKTLLSKRGIEVGNIFQLGYHYSAKMKDATFTDVDGSKKPYYMGCYGIGLGRTLAAIVEVSHDEKGIIWPESVTPYQVHLVGLSQKAEKIYQTLLENSISVLFDDRENVSAGEKFADSDLIGIPARLVVSEKTGDKIEWKKRSEAGTQLLSLDEVLQKLPKEALQTD